MTWQNRATCADDETFHRLDPASVRNAIVVCRTCPVVMECFDWALEEGSYDGVAGGRYWKNGEQVAPPVSQRRWTRGQMLRAHRAYSKGLRDEDTKAGERAYNAALARARRAAA